MKKVASMFGLFLLATCIVSPVASSGNYNASNFAVHKIFAGVLAADGSPRPPLPPPPAAFDGSPRPPLPPPPALGQSA